MPALYFARFLKNYVISWGY